MSDPGGRTSVRGRGCTSMPRATLSNGIPGRYAGFSFAFVAGFEYPDHKTEADQQKQQHTSQADPDIDVRDFVKPSVPLTR